MERLRSYLNDWNIPIHERQLKAFEIYYQLLNEWNQRMNLTTITDMGDVIIKHFLDSISIVKTEIPCGSGPVRQFSWIRPVMYAEEP